MGDVWTVLADCGGETSGWRMVGTVASLSWGRGLGGGRMDVGVGVISAGVDGSVYFHGLEFPRTK